MSFLSKLFGTKPVKKPKMREASVGAEADAEVSANNIDQSTSSQIMEQMENTLAEVNGLTQKFVVDIEDIDDDDDDDFNFDFDGD